MPLFRFLPLLAFLLLFAGAMQTAQATHLRAGQITAVRDSTNLNTLTYIFTLTLYRDNCEGVDQEKAKIFFTSVDDKIVFGSEEVGVGVRRQVAPCVQELIYTFRYTFGGAGQYKIYFAAENRNRDVVNMNLSVDTPFYVETILTISPTLGVNNTPILLNPPIDQARVGQRFCHNPAAFDPDGDSLAYRFSVPRQKNPNNENSLSTPVSGYVSPERAGPPLGVPEPPATGAPTFTINPLTGEICWDSPGKFRIGSKGFAEYNIAFVVEEWRRTSAGFIKIGEVVRDMQITVRDQPNNRPELFIPNDTCIVAGSALDVFIRATDRDANQRIRISSESAIFSKLRSVFPAQPSATLDPANTPPTLPASYVYQGNPAQSRFRWQTDCQHVRSQPYDVVFKAEDNVAPPNQLTDTRTWRITVVGPAPTGLRAQAEGRGIRLNWNRYRCPNAAQIVVWRRQGCSNEPVDPCPKGGPAGYTAIGRVGANVTTFLDNTVQSGVQYSYRITANFGAPGLGVSIASPAVCARLRLDAPLIVNVSVQATSRQNGQIRVRFAEPLELDATAFPPPYRYDVYRATGFTRGFGNAPIRSFTVTEALPSTSARYQEFTDQALDLNTEDNPYTYVVLLYSNGQFRDSSRTASSVRLAARPLPSAIELTWRADVPWDNTNQRHVVYREDQTKKGRIPKEFIRLAEVPVTTASTFRFTDTGNGITFTTDSAYCYRVETIGSYNEPRIESPLSNFSQEICASPLDTVKPCAVTLSIDPTKCGEWASEEGSTQPSASFCSQAPFSNRLTWTYPTQEGTKVCREQDVFKYRIYYKRYEEDGLFALIDSVISPAPPSKEYLHKNLPSFAGCYYVTAVDRSNNESAPSNTVCQDNCPYYLLPNVISPDNGDTLNQALKPYPCPRFIESGKITIVNRWGRIVFETDNINVNWSGRLNGNAEVADATELAPGVYYYSAQLKTTRLRRKDENMVVKGWVQILR